MGESSWMRVAAVGGEMAVMMAVKMEKTKKHEAGWRCLLCVVGPKCHRNIDVLHMRFEERARARNTRVEGVGRQKEETAKVVLHQEDSKHCKQ